MKKQKQRNKKDESFAWAMWALVFMLIALVLVYLFRTNFFKNEKYKEELQSKIAIKEQKIASLLADITQMMNLEQTFRNQALRLYKIIKIVVVVFLIGIFLYVLLYPALV